MKERKEKYQDIINNFRMIVIRNYSIEYIRQIKQNMNKIYIYVHMLNMVI